jgi:hypothetical protein
VILCIGISGAVRGKDQQSDNLFSYMRLETRIPADHLSRPIRTLVDEALLELSPAFSKLYAREGLPSIAVGDATVFRTNRDRLLDGDIARKFMAFSASS